MIAFTSARDAFAHPLELPAAFGVFSGMITGPSTGVEGPVIIPLKTPNAAGNSSGCAKASRALVKAIIAHPARYYVNVHTAESPVGAVRQQLVGWKPVPGA